MRIATTTNSIVTTVKPRMLHRKSNQFSQHVNQAFRGKYQLAKASLHNVDPSGKFSSSLSPEIQ
ncbi:hypothetical protein F444_11268 [Phytophthora nicotianae P1976]|uniref:Uncharacterized protein n=1 Tax=Phytophthora nicotianae P1976 TaxID=1317066 RepID=A0A081A1G6_PHYNI|nr:hypothetical protein F444_11268 [Phytophthora nicotianae P1976]